MMSFFHARFLSASKKIALLSIFLLSAPLFCIDSLEKRLFLPPSMSFTQGRIVYDHEQTTLSPENTVIFFDWDDVMVSPTMKERLTKVIEHPFQTFKFFLGNLIGIIIPNYIFNAVKYNVQGAEAIARNLTKIDPALARFVLQLGNVNIPRKGMRELVGQLKSLAYDLSIVTGKERELFELEYKKPLLRTLYNLFPKILIVDTQNSGTALPASGLTVKTSSSKKPAESYFIQAQQEFNPNDKYVLFIDDNVKNFVPLSESNSQEWDKKWIGLKFNNPEQLKEDLVALGILSAQ